MKKLVDRWVDFGGRHPLVMLLGTLIVAAVAWHFALKVLSNPHTDLLELLPRDSPGFRAFEHQLGRVGGGATLVVVVESPDRSANERFIDDLSAKLDGIVQEHAACVGACAPGDEGCRAACGPQLIGYVESGTKEVRAFFERNKWLYASLEDLEKADETLDHQIAIRSGLVTDLEGDDERTPAAQGKAMAPEAPGAPPPPKQDEKKAAFGMDEYRARWEAEARKHDEFPTGYFATPDGRMHGIRIVSQTSGTGDIAGDMLLARVEQITRELGPEKYHPEMKVGFAGDIANVVAEKASIVSEAAWASGLAFVLILGGVVIFFRSAWSLIVIALPALLGVGVAYAFAWFKFGYVNITGMFLGAIILGNGINYPIVLLSRYREFRARGLSPEEARRTAVWNAFRAELVGATVASIAYGSLTITQFRGFNQFGWIGFVGMLLVWLSMIPCVPALIVINEWIQSKLPVWMRDPPPVLATDGSRGPVTRAIANVTERYPWVFVILGVGITVAAATKLPSFLRDPWEYNFDRLGSRGSKTGGAGEWSNKAEKVFGGKMNIAGALMLADTPEQVPLLKAQIFENDAADPEGKLIKEIATIDDFLPGTEEEQRKKLEVLDRIRDRLTERVLFELPPDERARVLELKPPEDLQVLHGKDLPALIRRRFEENNGVVGTVFYVKYWDFARNSDISHSDGRTLLRIAKTTDNVRLPDGTVVQTASRATVFAEMIRSMERDGPLATAASFCAVMVVVVLATRNVRGAISVLSVLVMSVIVMVGGAAMWGMKLHYVNFIALPITFGIGCEYPFNVYDRSRLLNGDISSAVKRVGGAVALCSFTTVIGYGSLLFADNQALQSFGRLAGSGELVALAAAMFVLPSLLHLLVRLNRKATFAADRAADANMISSTQAPRASERAAR